MSYTPSLNGDVKGPTANNLVEGFQGRTVTATAPVTGNAYTWNGAAWAPGAPIAQQPSFSRLFLLMGG